MNLRPQDVLILLKVAACPDDAPLRQLDLARSLALSPAEVSNAFQRAAYADLFVHSDRGAKRLGRIGKIRRTNLCEFATHGLRYAFPARLGEVAVGMPTAWGGPPLSKVIVAGDDGVPIWPHAGGSRRGMAIDPLYETAPQAAAQDERLYELLALVDAMRVGRARERALAANLLRERLVPR